MKEIQRDCTNAREERKTLEAMPNSLLAGIVAVRL